MCSWQDTAANGAGKKVKGAWRRHKMRKASKKARKNVHFRNGASFLTDVHERSALELLRLFCVNKGVYVKLGQLMAQLDYLLPDEYVQILRVTTHAAPVDTWAQVGRRK